MPYGAAVPIPVLTHAQRVLLRHNVRSAVRSYFEGHTFWEVEPPTLVAAPGMEPAITALELPVDDGTRVHRRWLHTSPEFHMKRLLSEGCSRLYAMCRVFRSGETGPHHRVEFTMLEWYRRDAPYEVLMEDCEGFITACADRILQTRQVGALSLQPPFERLTVAEAFQRHAGVQLLDFVDPLDGPGLLRAAAKAGLHVVPGPPDQDPVTAFERAFYQIMLARVEPALGLVKPTFLLEWPAPLAALSRLSPSDPRVAQRVELYAAGLELGNGFGELTDPAEQRRRFEHEQHRRGLLGLPVYPLDEAFLSALARMPPASGMAVGLDRVLLLLTGAQDLAQVLPLENG